MWQVVDKAFGDTMFVGARKKKKNDNKVLDDKHDRVKYLSVLYYHTCSPPALT